MSTSSIASTIMKSEDPSVEKFMLSILKKDPMEPEFLQAVREVAEHVIPYTEDNSIYKKEKIFSRMCEPERVFIFRVPWADDNGVYHINRGIRVQMNSAIGPYKGGLRFHPSVNLSILKFLAFEQVFKNSLTTLPIGGGKGGADFDPKHRSEREIMKFCQSFMTELAKHIGPNRDVPAGDIGVGSREIGFLFGQYKRLSDSFEGVITGKAHEWGGSLIRPEATGYGCVYFAEEMLKTRSDNFSGKTVTISGSGNVAQYAAEKVIELGGKVVTLSDSGGYMYDADGIDAEKLAYVKDLKEVKRGRISEYAEKYGTEYFEGQRPWGVKCDVALPCATQNEIDEEDARTLLSNGCFVVSEGANMPSTAAAIDVYLNHKILYGPGKAANAGGVAVSGLEMSQNAQRLSWTREEVDQKLHEIMVHIHVTCLKYGAEGDFVNYAKGANVGGFVKVADSMLAQGLV